MCIYVVEQKSDEMPAYNKPICRHEGEVKLKHLCIGKTVVIVHAEVHLNPHGSNRQNVVGKQQKHGRQRVEKVV